jgi:hypothetical protein
MTHNVPPEGISATTLCAYLREYPQGGIEALKQIKRSENRVKMFLKSMGVAPRKVGTIPANADPEEQARCVKEERKPRLEEAETGQRALFFVDLPLFACLIFELK